MIDRDITSWLSPSFPDAEDPPALGTGSDRCPVALPGPQRGQAALAQG